MNQLQSHPARPSRHRLCALATVALLGLLPMAAWHTATQAANPAANPATTPATTSATTAAEFNAAFELYQRALSGQAAAVDEAARRWAELSAAEPGDPVLRAYAGSSTALLATTTLLPWRKMTHAEDGLALLDKALAMLSPAHDAPAHQGVPASLETRLIAASTFLGLPAMFNRQARGAKLLDELLRQPLLDGAPLPFRGVVWMTAANNAIKSQRNDEARQWLQKIVASAAPQAAVAQAKLKAL